MTNFDLFATWLKNTWRTGLIIVYFLVVLIVSTILIYDRYRAVPEVPVATPAVAVVPEPRVDLTPVEDKLKQLETAVVKTNERVDKSDTAQIQEQIRRLERRLQAQLEYNKRLCEYIMVITVDKKIVPRQCLPEYKWQREEGL
ncbi:MAG: hypothetical protein EB101_09135 [Chitinophagia bacterium]|nr:hypothetical protein [Chitinophagia bacterium]